MKIGSLIIYAPISRDKASRPGHISYGDPYARAFISLAYPMLIIGTITRLPKRSHITPSTSGPIMVLLGSNNAIGYDTESFLDQCIQMERMLLVE